jgi:hypothetical protein
MFVIVNIKRYIESVGIFMIYLHTEFHAPSSSDSFIITISLKSKYRFRAAEILFYIKQCEQKLHNIQKPLPHTNSKPFIKSYLCRFHLRTSCCRHVGIIFGRKLENRKVGWSLLSWCAYQVSWSYWRGRTRCWYRKCTVPYEMICKLD